MLECMFTFLNGNPEAKRLRLAIGQGYEPHLEEVLIHGGGSSRSRKYSVEHGYALAIVLLK